MPANASSFQPDGENALFITYIIYFIFVIRSSGITHAKVTQILLDSIKRGSISRWHEVITPDPRTVAYNLWFSPFPGSSVQMRSTLLSLRSDSFINFATLS